ncbi:helix-turn-helix transcriptional regulator [Alloscardovia criceti]|uniref:helix-turn-helix transcriptional regulator n=1 Tax=Alloscardovia criceti TaxID=356828 RepID=UPI00036D4F3F|nr:helix-turn-helix domain-containing protein [Alloscardovia criceti]
MDTEILTPDTASKYLHITKGTLANMRYQSTGPTFIKVTPRKILYRKCDLDAWLESKAEEYERATRK